MLFLITEITFVLFIKNKFVIFKSNVTSNPAVTDQDILFNKLSLKNRQKQDTRWCNPVALAFTAERKKDSC